MPVDKAAAARHRAARQARRARARLLAQVTAALHRNLDDYLAEPGRADALLAAATMGAEMAVRLDVRLPEGAAEAAGLAAAGTREDPEGRAAGPKIEVVR